MAERRPPTGWSSRALIIRSLACLGLLLLPATFPLASAAFVATAGTANTASTATLEPPSALAATWTCAPGPGIVARGARSATGLSSLALTPPVGTVAGDLLLAQVTNRNGPSTLTVPGGWTLVGARTTAPGSSTVTSAMYWKWAAGGEGTSTFVLGTADTQMVGGVVAYSGVHPSGPIDDSADLPGAGTVATAPSVTTTAANAMLVHAFAKRQESIPAATGTAPLWSLLSGSGAGNLGATAGEVLFAGPGVTPTRSTTGSNTFEWVTHTVALRPALGAPSASLTWTASPSTWATGYRLERSVGGTVQATATVTPISATATSSGPLVKGTTYGFRLWAYYGTWVSSSVTGGLTPSC